MGHAKKGAPWARRPSTPTDGLREFGPLARPLAITLGLLTVGSVGRGAKVFGTMREIREAGSIMPTRDPTRHPDDGPAWRDGLDRASRMDWRARSPLQGSGSHEEEHGAR
jgi:hypothetical protein